MALGAIRFANISRTAARLRTVLQDVVKAMFTRDFIAELFKPQELYSSASARQIFDKLAHSSIMRLSTSSMNKVCQPERGTSCLLTAAKELTALRCATAV